MENKQQKTLPLPSPLKAKIGTIIKIITIITCDIHLDWQTMWHREAAKGTCGNTMQAIKEC